MTYPNTKHLNLSDKMKTLKQQINLLKKERESTISNMLHKRGKLTQLIFDGLQKLLDLLSAIINFTKELPLIGFIIRMIATIPTAITTLTDKQSTIKAKAAAMSLLLVTTGLGIAAFAVGGLFAAQVSLALIGVGTLVEGIKLIGSFVTKYKTSKAYTEKKEFMSLLEQRDSKLEDAKFRERLEIRALELKCLFEKKSTLLTKELEEKLDFINQIRIKKEWDKIPLPKESPVTKLAKKYEERDALVVFLERTIKLINDEEKETSTYTYIDLVSNIQHEISEIDKEIDKITQPLHELQRNDLKASEDIAKSFTNFALGVVGLLLLTVGLLAIMGTLAVPPLAASIIFGFSIGLAAFGIIKWGAEYYYKKQDEKEMKAREKEHEETALEEALDCYDHDLNKNYSHQGKCSYTDSLIQILSAPTSNDENVSDLESNLQEKQVLEEKPRKEQLEEKTSLNINQSLSLLRAK